MSTEVIENEVENADQWELNLGKKPLSERQQDLYDFICKFHSDNGVVPDARAITNAMGWRKGGQVTSMLRNLVSKGWLDRYKVGLKVYYDLPNSPTLRRQYIRLAPGRGASIGNVFIGCVQQEGDEGAVQVIEVIAPESMGDLKHE